MWLLTKPACLLGDEMNLQEVKWDSLVPAAVILPAQEVTDSLQCITADTHFSFLNFPLGSAPFYFSQIRSSFSCPCLCLDVLLGSCSDSCRAWELVRQRQANKMIFWVPFPESCALCSLPAINFK